MNDQDLHELERQVLEKSAQNSQNYSLHESSNLSTIRRKKNAIFELKSPDALSISHKSLADMLN